MIHITKSRTGFQVIEVGKNGEPLNSSEVLTSRNKCWKNIAARMTDHPGIVWLDVQDDTGKQAIRYRFDGASRTKSIMPPKPKYKAGRNRK